MNTPDLFSHADRYPHSPGAQATDTSRAAADSMRADAPTLRELCKDALSWRDMTADEVALAIEESILAVRPRLTELKRLGEVKDTGTRRPNASGRSAIVWRLA